MKDYNEDEFIMLSGIQHYKFCKRQWALIHIENQWQENERTISGEIMHEKVHNIALNEKRKDVIVSRAMPIKSYTMGVSGECDAVEFIKDNKGVEIIGKQGKYKIYPVEYKKGKPKTNDEDISQLVAQAICLEEMFCCEIEKGYLYYGETRHRMEIVFNDDMKKDVRKNFDEMHNLLNRKYTPKSTIQKHCNACSLKNICMPILNKKESAKNYILKNINEI